MRVEGEPAYDALRESIAASRARLAGNRGEPLATVPTILQIVDMDEPLLRLFLGEGPHDIIRAEYAKRLEEWERFETVSRAAHRLS